MSVIGVYGGFLVAVYGLDFYGPGFVRNISDELMKACAKKGGVIGINGIGKFLGAACFIAVMVGLTAIYGVILSIYGNPELDFIQTTGIELGVTWLVARETAASLRAAVAPAGPLVVPLVHGPRADVDHLGAVVAGAAAGQGQGADQPRKAHRAEVDAPRLEQDELGMGRGQEDLPPEPLEEIVASGKVPAQRLLDKFHGEWGGDIARVYEESF